MSKISSVCEVRKIDRKEWKMRERERTRERETETKTERDRETERERHLIKEKIYIFCINYKIGTTRILIIHWAYLTA